MIASWETDGRGTCIWTIGHGDRDFDSVAALLNRQGIQTIVDIRSEPYSRWAPDFTKRALQEATSAAGFGYRWLGRQLGGRPPPEDPEEADARLTAGLDELVGLCHASRVVLLCSELDPLGCHRNTVLAPALASRGYTVIHIDPAGHAMAHQDSLGI